MIRLPLTIAAGAVAATAAVVPAILGLTGNPSFSQQVPVRVPAHATVATFPAAAASADDPSRSHRPEPGDDRRGIRTRKPEPGDDRGGIRSREPEPGDDRGGVGGRAEDGRHGGRDG